MCILFKLTNLFNNIYLYNIFFIALNNYNLQWILFANIIIIITFFFTFCTPSILMYMHLK